MGGDTDIRSRHGMQADGQAAAGYFMTSLAPNPGEFTAKTMQFGRMGRDTEIRCQSP